MAANIELWMSFDEEYQLTLSIPVATLHSFSVRPLAWLRYLASTIYGTEGYISSEKGGDEVDYNTSTDFCDQYYYVSEGK